MIIPLILTLSSLAFGQEETIKEVNIPLSDICREYQASQLEKKHKDEESICPPFLKNQNPSMLAIQNIVDKVGPEEQSIQKLCDHLKQMKTEAKGKLNDLVIEVEEDANPQEKKVKEKWIYRIQLGTSYGQYGRSDLVIDSPHMKGTIKDIHFDHRGSYAYFNLAENVRDPNKSFFQFLDEPTNNFVFEAEKKDKYLIGLKIYHPKITARATDKDFGDINANPKNSDLEVDLTVEGQKIVGRRDLWDYFWFFEITKQLYHADAYINKVIPILPKTLNPKAGSLDLSVGVNLGVYGGFQKNTYMPNPSVSDTEKNSKWGLIGYSFGVNQKLSYTFPQERFVLSLQHDLMVSYFNFKMLGGKGTIPKMNSQVFSVLLGVNLNSHKKKK